MKKGNKYGTHRVIEPKGVLPQSASKISNDMEIYDDEMLIDVKALNIDSASFLQLMREQKYDLESVKDRILSIVNEKGKMQNPVTGSGGMLIGSVEKIGERVKSEAYGAQQPQCIWASLKKPNASLCGLGKILIYACKLRIFLGRKPRFLNF